jgi:endoglucanase
MEGSQELTDQRHNESSGGGSRLSRRGVLTAAGAALAVPAVWSALKPNAANGMMRSRVGVSIAGGEFSSDRPSFSNEHLGSIEVDYTYNSEKSFSYFSSKGFRLQRLPFRWERLQPIPGGALDPSALAALRLRADWAKKHGARLILDCHNYARYVLPVNGVPTACALGERVGSSVPITPEHLINLWLRISKALGDHIGIDGWGLMNEPHGLGRVSWKNVSQSLVSALRKGGDKKRIFVAGDEWSSAHRWPEINGLKPWIKDPLGRTVYEAHCYFDSNGSGKYTRSFSREFDENKRMMNRGVENVTPFLDWCSRNRVNGMIGEFGVPAKDPAWEEVIRRFLAVVNDAAMEAVYWAGGEWWGSYPLSIQPTKNFTVDSPLVKVLQA